MPTEVVAVLIVFWLFSLLAARMDGERIGYWKGEAAAARRQREAIERECDQVAQLRDSLTEGT